MNALFDNSQESLETSFSTTPTIEPDDSFSSAPVPVFFQSSSSGSSKKNDFVRVQSDAVEVHQRLKSYPVVRIMNLLNDRFLRTSDGITIARSDHHTGSIIMKAMSSRARSQ